MITAQTISTYKGMWTNSDPYRASWRNIPEDRVNLYSWMVEQMKMRQFPMNDSPPIWAWTDDVPLATIQSLYPGKMIEMNTQVVLIHFSPVHEHVLYSSYSKFTELWMAMENRIPIEHFASSVFAIQIDQVDDTQITLPWLSRCEVQKVELLTLRPKRLGGPILSDYKDG